MPWTAFAEEVRSRGAEAALLAGTVTQRRERRTKSGGRIGIVTVSDPTGQFEALVYPERLSDWRDALEPGRSLFLHVGAEYDAEMEDIRVRVNRIEPLEEIAASALASMRVALDGPEAVRCLKERLDTPGEAGIAILVRDAAGPQVEIRPKAAGRGSHEAEAPHSRRPARP